MNYKSSKGFTQLKNYNGKIQLSKQNKATKNKLTNLIKNSKKRSIGLSFLISLINSVFK